MIRTGITAFLALALGACAANNSNTTPGESMTDQKESKQLSSPAKAYDQQCRGDLAEARNLLTKLQKHEGEQTVATILKPLDQLGLLIEGGAARASLYRNVHPDPDLRQVAERCEQDFSKIGTELSLSRAIYDSVAALDVSGADPITQRVAAHTLRDFRRSGVDKSEEIREKIRKLKEELVLIGQDFSRNIRSDVRSIELDSADGLKGLPKDFIKEHPPAKDGKIRVTTDYPDYVPFMTYAQNDGLRKQLFMAFNNRGWPKNDDVLKKMISRRHQLATLLGYESFAAYATEDKMIRTAGAAKTFIDKVSDLVDKRSSQDLELLLKRLQKDQPKAELVTEWQTSYLAELVKRDDYAFDSQSLRAYFPYTNVKQGILDLASELYGVTIKPADVPVWHPSVESYELFEGGELRGRFYLDMHPRADKYKHAAVFDFQKGIKGKQLPEGSLVCNFPGGDGGPGLMDHNSVETFFHEFGHLLHHLFAGQQDWAEVSGISTEWDFVEAPSQLMEEWAWEPKVLKRFAQNDKGETLPDELIEKMRAARDFGLGLWVKRQMYYAALSLTYYTSGPDLDTTGVMEKLSESYSPLPHVPGTHKQTGFGHLYGYSSNYYTYMWSLVIAKDLFAKIKQDGMLDPKVVSNYRQKILDPGGSQDAADLVNQFLGREFNFDAFGAWLEQP